ncbi:MAG: hypothetical protein ACRDNI_08200 [Gaiellaceae bacterium]
MEWAMRTDTADLFGVVLWMLQAVFFATWALLSLARHGGEPAAAVLAAVAFGAAVLGYRRARSLRSA